MMRQPICASPFSFIRFIPSQFSTSLHSQTPVCSNELFCCCPSRHPRCSTLALMSFPAHQRKNLGHSVFIQGPHAGSTSVASIFNDSQRSHGIQSISALTKVPIRFSTRESLCLKTFQGKAYLPLPVAGSTHTSFFFFWGVGAEFRLHCVSLSLPFLFLS